MRIKKKLRTLLPRDNLIVNDQVATFIGVWFAQLNYESILPILCNVPMPLGKIAGKVFAYFGR